MLVVAAVLTAGIASSSLLTTPSGIASGPPSGRSSTPPGSRAVPATARVPAVPALVHEPARALAAEAALRAPADAASRRRMARKAKNPYRTFARQRGRVPWWNRPSGIVGSRWVYPYFPSACYQADTAAGGTAASAWQVLWVYPAGTASRLAPNLRVLRLAARGAQSIYAASAGRYIADQGQLFSRSLAPRFVTTSGCEPDVRPVAVPASVYHHGMVWPGSSSGTPFGPGTVTEWLLDNGYAAPNRKYVVVLQTSPSYRHSWAGISEDLAAQAGAAGEVPGLDNPANYTSFSYVDSTWVLGRGRSAGAAAYPAQVIAHEMTHAMGAMTETASHDSADNPLHPTDCWDLLCYRPPTNGQTYRNGCGGPQGWRAARVARGYLRLDCNRDDYWAPASDAGAARATWTTRRWAVSSSSFLYGNPQPTAAQLDAHRR